MTMHHPRAKPSAQLAAAFDAALPKDDRILRRPMFGMPAAFVNGNMFAGLYEESVALRLPEPKRQELLALAGAGPFEPMPGRAMREYAVVPPSMHADTTALAAWLAAAFEFGLTIPAKTAKPARPGNRR
jgi:TfoX/Sxy family transcriptional regulator of competence genes